MNINEEKVKELQTSVEKYKKEYQLYLKTKKETLKGINERIYLLFKSLFDTNGMDFKLNSYNDKELNVIIDFTESTLKFSKVLNAYESCKSCVIIDKNYIITNNYDKDFYSYICNNVNFLYTRTAEFIINTMKRNIDQLQLSIPIV
jgi:hypothetical protein